MASAWRSRRRCQRHLFSALLAPVVAYWLPVAIDVYGRHALRHMLQCEAQVFEAVLDEFPVFLNSGTLLGAARDGGWILHDRLAHGGGDVDLGVVVPAELRHAAVHRLRTESRRTCGHFVISRDDWFSTTVMSKVGYWGAYGVRTSLMRIYSPWKPFVFLDVDEYIPSGGRLLCRNPSGGERLALAEPSSASTSASTHGLEPLARSFMRLQNVLPLTRCQFDGVPVRCPANVSGVLKDQYGSSWQTPLHRDGQPVQEQPQPVVLSQVALFSAGLLAAASDASDYFRQLRGLHEAPAAAAKAGRFWRQWRALRAEIHRQPAVHTSHLLENLIFYDMGLDAVASIGGLLRVWRSIASSVFNELPTNSTESAHALRPFYFRPFTAEAQKASLVSPQPTKWHMRSSSMDLGPLPTGDLTIDRACGILEAAAPKIRAEFLAALHLRQGMLLPHPDAQNEAIPTIASARPAWNWEPLFGVGGWSPSATECFPATHKALTSLDLCANFGFAFFSSTKPGTHIRPHTGSSNLRIRLHLGLIVPDEGLPPADGGSYIRVGNQTKGWAAGKCFAFDDAYEHEVVVPTSASTERVILIADIWHPGLTPKERALLNKPIFSSLGKDS